MSSRMIQKGTKMTYNQGVISQACAERICQQLMDLFAAGYGDATLAAELVRQLEVERDNAQKNTLVIETSTSSPE